MPCNFQPIVTSFVKALFDTDPAFRAPYKKYNFFNRQNASYLRDVAHNHEVVARLFIAVNVVGINNIEADRTAGKKPPTPYERAIQDYYFKVIAAVLGSDENIETFVGTMATQMDKHANDFYHQFSGVMIKEADLIRFPSASPIVSRRNSVGGQDSGNADYLYGSRGQASVRSSSASPSALRRASYSSQPSRPLVTGADPGDDYVEVNGAEAAAGPGPSRRGSVGSEDALYAEIPGWQDGGDLTVSVAGAGASQHSRARSPSSPVRFPADLQDGESTLTLTNVINPYEFSPGKVAINKRLYDISQHAVEGTWHAVEGTPFNKPRHQWLGYYGLRQGVPQPISLDENCQVFIGDTKIPGCLPSDNVSVTKSGYLICQTADDLYLGKINISSDLSSIAWIRLDFTARDLDGQIKHLSLCPEGKLLAVVLASNTLYIFKLTALMFEPQYKGKSLKVHARISLASKQKNVYDLKSIAILPAVDEAVTVLLLYNTMEGFWTKATNYMLYAISSTNPKNAWSETLRFFPPDMKTPETALCAVSPTQFLLWNSTRLQLMDIQNKEPNITFSQLGCVQSQQIPAPLGQEGFKAVCSANNGASVIAVSGENHEKIFHVQDDRLPGLPGPVAAVAAAPARAPSPAPVAVGNYIPEI